jgi:hypothetical protein
MLLPKLVPSVIRDRLAERVFRQRLGGIVSIDAAGRAGQEDLAGPVPQVFTQEHEQALEVRRFGGEGGGGGADHACAGAPEDHPGSGSRPDRTGELLNAIRELRQRAWVIVPGDLRLTRIPHGHCGQFHRDRPTHMRAEQSPGADDPSEHLPHGRGIVRRFGLDTIR